MAVALGRSVMALIQSLNDRLATVAVKSANSAAKRADETIDEQRSLMVEASHHPSEHVRAAAAIAQRRAQSVREERERAR